MHIRILLSLVLAVVATCLAPNTFAQQLLYIHADHLNTPRLVTNGSGTPVWRWDQIEPFGDNLPNEDPDGNGTPGHMPLRFPGQYYDKETNLSYNYYRDYDPAIGRYIESDPIGLDGGINVYAYVAASPLLLIDPTGEAEHRKGARPSTKEKHKAGQAKQQTDRGGEKADEKRWPPRKKPPNYKGPWPPKTPRICIPIFMYNWLTEMCYEDPNSGACLILPPDPNDPCKGMSGCI